MDDTRLNLVAHPENEANFSEIVKKPNSLFIAEVSQSRVLGMQNTDRNAFAPPEEWYVGIGRMGLEKSG